MGADRWDRIKAVVADALEHDVAERGAFLDEELRDEPELRQRVDALLEQTRAVGSFLETPPHVPTLEATNDELPSGETIGRYRIVRRIASGGAGTVYEAVQERPSRKVALKLLHAAGGELARRFEQESELLAQLQHRGIAHVYEAGVHGDGAWQVPFIAMELVEDARTITDYVDSEELSVEERLELVIKVCQAVQHGHDRGVVHRDLKPHNILVGADGQPKVIDFGVARVLREDTTGTVHTTAGDLIGTLPYMSPEQCGKDPDAVDARADVYALGVVLFELLSSRLPLGVVGLPIEEAVQAIRLRAPTRLSRIAPQLGKDLDAVTSMTLNKDPDGRYAGAADLAADLERILEHRPVVARPPGVTYRSRLFVKRHRYGAIAVMVIVVALAVATGISMLYAFRADYQSRVAKLTNYYLHEMMTAPDPHRSGADVTVLELLDRMVQRLETEPVELPEVEMAVRNAIGDTYLALFKVEPAIQQLTRVVELGREVDASNEDLSDVLITLGVAYSQIGDDVSSERCYREALELRVDIPDADDTTTAIVMGNLADNLMRQDKLEAALEMAHASVAKFRESGIGSGPEFAGNVRRAGRILQRMGRRDEYEAILLEVLELAGVPDEHPVVTSTYTELGRSRTAAGDHAGAREFFEKAWKAMLAHRQAGSMDWNITMMGYFQCLEALDERESALSLLREVHAALVAELGEDDYRAREVAGLLAEYAERWHREEP